MSNIFVPDSNKLRHDSATDSVNLILLNTKCIVCRSVFHKPRAGKLYCSPRCKQFSYNHKAEISDKVRANDCANNPSVLFFYLQDYILYDRTVKKIRRFHELDKKRKAWTEIELSVKLKIQNGLVPSDSMWDQFAKRKLTESDDFELYDLDTWIDDDLILLTVKPLSIEQWSFIKSIYPDLDGVTFFELVSSLSVEFLGQLSLEKLTPVKGLENLIIKNRFISHCNLITSGMIKLKKSLDNAE